MTPLSTHQAAAQLTGGQGDETGWRINDQTAGAWGFRDPSLALFLIERHCSREVLMRVMGASFADTLVSDFYAAYHGRDCPKQRPNCGDELPGPSVRAFIQPLLTLVPGRHPVGEGPRPTNSQSL